MAKARQEEFAVYDRAATKDNAVALAKMLATGSKVQWLVPDMRRLLHDATGTVRAAVRSPTRETRKEHHKALAAAARSLRNAITMSYKECPHGLEELWENQALRNAINAPPDARTGRSEDMQHFMRELEALWLAADQAANRMEPQRKRTIFAQAKTNLVPVVWAYYKRHCTDKRQWKFLNFANEVYWRVGGDATGCEVQVKRFWPNRRM